MGSKNEFDEMEAAKFIQKYMLKKYNVELELNLVSIILDAEFEFLKSKGLIKEER